ncbi:MAG: hypothetical protein PUP91_14835 [Rhizonema sp. PD37]|nr:hypothetical protein [Rhizonema sp. PD37]
MNVLLPFFVSSNPVALSRFDAMGTLKSIAQKIIAGNADYILSLKDNHPLLHQQLKNWQRCLKNLHG